MAKPRAKIAEPEDMGVPLDDDKEELDVIELDQNLSDIPEPELLPRAWYRAEIQDVEARMNQKGTGKYFAVQFIIPVENFPAGYDPANYPDGLKLYFNLLRVPTPGDRRASKNVREFMIKLGLAVDTQTIDPNQWIGREVRLKVDHGTWEGNKREEIARNGIQPVE